MLRVGGGVHLAKFVVDFIIISDIDVDFDPDFLIENGNRIIVKCYWKTTLVHNSCYNSRIYIESFIDLKKAW